MAIVDVLFERASNHIDRRKELPPYLTVTAREYEEYEKYLLAFGLAKRYTIHKELVFNGIPLKVVPSEVV